MEFNSNWIPCSNMDYLGELDILIGFFSIQESDYWRIRDIYCILQAFYFELVGPTMPILAENTKTHYNGMGSVLASRAAGYLAGNIFGIFLQNIVKRHSEGLLICAFILPAIGKTKLSVNKKHCCINFSFFSDFCNAFCIIIVIDVYFVFY